MLGSARKEPAFLDAVERVRLWTRQRFGLSDDAAILVAELTCTIPACPPLETAVAFWTEDDRRHQFKLLKPVEEVSYEDIAWLIGSLTDHADSGWECC